MIGNTSNTTFTISGLDNGTRYYFRVAAVNASNLEGTASNTINLTPAFSGPIWWVALNGNDNNEGSESNSLGSIAKAVEKASSGDTIIVKPGTYDMQEVLF